MPILEREGKFDENGLKTYVKTIIDAFVENRDEVVVDADNTDNQLTFTIRVAEEDYEKLTGLDNIYDPIRKIIIKATDANLGITAALEPF